MVPDLVTMLTLAPTDFLLVTSKFIDEMLYSSIASNDSGWFSDGRPFASSPNESLVGTASIVMLL